MITKRIQRTLTLLLLTLGASCNLFAQDWHPGIPGQDASGGKTIKIPLKDLQMHGVIYYPALPKIKAKKLPAIIIVHGWSSYSNRAGEAYTYVAKEYSNNGFIALAITLRGWPETGGVDDCGLKQPHDVASAVTWLSKQPMVDANKIGLMGQSLGGQVVLSAAALTRTVKAVAAYFPITEFRLWGITTNHNQRIKDEYIYGLCAKEGKPEDRSPLYKANNITGAVLFLHGENDQNVSVLHSKLMYQKMREAKKDVALYIAKNGAHGSGGTGWENHDKVVYDFFHEKLK